MPLKLLQEGEIWFQVARKFIQKKTAKRRRNKWLHAKEKKNSTHATLEVDFVFHGVCLLYCCYF